MTDTSQPSPERKRCRLTAPIALIFLILTVALSAQPAAAQDDVIAPGTGLEPAPCGGAGERWCAAPPTWQFADRPWLRALCDDGLQPCRNGPDRGYCATCCADVLYECGEQCNVSNDADCETGVAETSWLSTFVAFADFQADFCANYRPWGFPEEDNLLASARRLLSEDTGLFVHAGDLIQSRGPAPPQYPLEGIGFCARENSWDGWRPDVDYSAPYDFEMVKSLLQPLYDQGRIISAQGNHDRHALTHASSISLYFRDYPHTPNDGEFLRWFPIESPGSRPFDPYCGGRCAHRQQAGIYHIVLHLYGEFPGRDEVDYFIDDLTEHLRRASTSADTTVLTLHRRTNEGSVEEHLVRPLAEKYGVELVITGHFDEFGVEHQPGGHPLYLALPKSAGNAGHQLSTGYTRFTKFPGGNMVADNEWITRGSDWQHLPTAYRDTFSVPVVPPSNGGPILYFHYTNVSGQRVVLPLTDAVQESIQFKFQGSYARRWGRRDENPCGNTPNQNPDLPYFRATPGAFPIDSCEWQDHWSGGWVPCNNEIVRRLNNGTRIYYNTDPWATDESAAGCPWTCEPWYQLGATMPFHVRLTDSNGATHERSFTLTKQAGSDSECLQ